MRDVTAVLGLGVEVRVDYYCPPDSVWIMPKSTGFRFTPEQEAQIQAAKGDDLKQFRLMAEFLGANGLIACAKNVFDKLSELTADSEERE